MKKILLSLSLGCLCNSLCGEEILPLQSSSPRATIQMSPYVYGYAFQPGYGVSIRREASGHTFELAPMTMPPTRGYFSNSRHRLGLTGSYYYAINRDNAFQPYLGISYTQLTNPQNGSISSLIGIQICRADALNLNKFSGYFFLDVLGPVFVDKFGLKAKNLVFPRIGAGLRF